MYRFFTGKQGLGTKVGTWVQNQVHRDKSGYIGYTGGYIGYTGGDIGYTGGDIGYTGGDIGYTSGYTETKLETLGTQAETLGTQVGTMGTKVETLGTQVGTKWVYRVQKWRHAGNTDLIPGTQVDCQRALCVDIPLSVKPFNNSDKKQAQSS